MMASEDRSMDLRFVTEAFGRGALPDWEKG
jgi:hypothetical protein